MPYAKSPFEKDYLLRLVAENSHRLSRKPVTHLNPSLGWIVYEFLLLDEQMTGFAICSKCDHLHRLSSSTSLMKAHKCVHAALCGDSQNATKVLHGNTLLEGTIQLLETKIQSIPGQADIRALEEALKKATEEVKKRRAREEQLKEELETLEAVQQSMVQEITELKVENTTLKTRIEAMEAKELQNAMASHSSHQEVSTQSDPIEDPELFTMVIQSRVAPTSLSFNATAPPKSNPNNVTKQPLTGRTPNNVASVVGNTSRAPTSLRINDTAPNSQLNNLTKETVTGRTGNNLASVVGNTTRAPLSPSTNNVNRGIQRQPSTRAPQTKAPPKYMLPRLLKK